MNVLIKMQYVVLKGGTEALRSGSKYWLLASVMSWDSSVGIAAGYVLDDPIIGVRFPAGTGNFSLRHRVQTCSGTHPASYSMGTVGSFTGRGVKRPEREVDYSPPSNTMVKECVELYIDFPNMSSWHGA
jgi:hypothetical protein